MSRYVLTWPALVDLRGRSINAGQFYCYFGQEDSDSKFLFIAKKQNLNNDKIISSAQRQSDLMAWGKAGSTTLTTTGDTITVSDTTASDFNQTLSHVQKLPISAPWELRILKTTAKVTKRCKRCKSGCKSHV